MQYKDSGIQFGENWRVREDLVIVFLISSLNV
jgi:hypothetical protein